MKVEQATNIRIVETGWWIFKRYKMILDLKGDGRIHLPPYFDLEVLNCFPPPKISRADKHNIVIDFPKK